MDRPNNLMVIESLVLFDEPVDWDRLVAVLRNRLVRRFPVFRQRPVPPDLPWSAPRWEDDPAFSIERHIHRATLPAPGDDAALRRYLDDHLREPLDRTRPLWEAHFIDGHNGGAALFGRFHHALVDGIALTHVLMSLSDTTPDGDLTEPVGSDEVTEGGADGVLGALRRAAGSLQATAASTIAGSARLVRRLPHLASAQGLGAALAQAWGTAAVAQKLLLGHNPATALDRTPGIDKHVAWSRPLPLADVKRVGRVSGATVNDVLMSALAGAISGYLVGRGEKAADLLTMVPVNVRPVGQPLPRELGNRFALVFLRLPSGIDAPLARLAETKRRMDVIKHSTEPALTFALTIAIGRTFENLERVLVDFFANKTIGVATNVFGPTSARYLAGTRIVGVLAWVPSSGAQTLGVSIVTYDGTVRVGFKVDADTVPRPDELVTAFDEQIRSLTRMIRTG